MKKLLIFFTILFLVSTAYSQEVITGFNITTDLPQVNEEFRSINNKIDNLRTKRLVWFKPNTLAAGTNVSARIDVSFSGTITKAIAYIKTAPTGATLILDINKNGTSIWATTQGKRLQIVATAATGTQTSFDTVSVSTNDYFTIDIDQVGSSVAGADLTVQLEIKEKI